MWLATWGGSLPGQLRYSLTFCGFVWLSGAELITLYSDWLNTRGLVGEPRSYPRLTRGQPLPVAQLKEPVAQLSLARLGGTVTEDAGCVLAIEARGGLFRRRAVAAGSNILGATRDLLA